MSSEQKTKQENKKLKKEAKIAEKEAKKAHRKLVKKSVKQLQHHSVSLPSRQSVPSAIRRQNAYQGVPAASRDMQTVACAVVREFQLRAPTALQNITTASPAAMVAYLMWAYYAKMRKIGQLRDKAGATSTAYDMNDFPDQYSIPTPFAKAIEYCCTYEEPVTGKVIASTVDWTGNPSVNQTSVNSSGTGLSLNTMFTIDGVTAMPLIAGDGDLYYNNLASGTWLNMTNGAAYISQLLDANFECCTIAEIPDWAPDASGHSMWAYDNSTGQNCVFSAFPRIDTEVPIVLNSPLSGVNPYPSSYEFPVAPVSIVATDQLVNSSLSATLRRSVVTGWVHALADIKYIMGPVQKLLKRHPHYVGLRYFAPNYQILDLSVYSDLITHYIRTSPDTWTNDLILAFVDYCYSILIAKMAEFAVYFPDATHKNWGYNVNAIGCPLPPLLANYVTALGPVVRGGRLVVPIPEQTSGITSFIQFFTSPSTTANNGSTLFGHYFTGFTANPTIGGTVFSAAVFTRAGFYSKAPFSKWPVIADTVRTKLTASWIVADDVKIGGKNMDCAANMSDVAGFAYPIIAGITQTTQCLFARMDSICPLNRLELGQVLATVCIGQSQYGFYHYDRGANEPNCATTLQELFVQSTSELSQALGVRMAERTKAKAVARRDGTVEVRAGGETAMDTLRVVLASEIEAQVDDENVNTEYVEDGYFDAYQYFVGGMKASLKKTGARLAASAARNLPNLVADIARAQSIPAGSKQYAALAAAVAADPQGFLDKSGLFLDKAGQYVLGY